MIMNDRDAVKHSRTGKDVGFFLAFVVA